MPEPGVLGVYRVYMLREWGVFQVLSSPALSNVSTPHLYAAHSSSSGGGGGGGGGSGGGGGGIGTIAVVA